MLGVTQYDHRPEPYTMERRGDKVDLWMRDNIEQIENEDGGFWQADEAYMEIPAADAPSLIELVESFADWFSYASEWEPEKPVDAEQLRADVDFLMALMGV